VGESAAAAWAAFGACAALIGAAGWVLCREGDAIAAKTALSRSWVGLILLATATSLPELITGISAVTAAAVPDIAVGDVLGSCVVNLALLGAVMLALPQPPRSDAVARLRRASAAWGLGLVGIAAAGLLAAAAGVEARIGYVGVYTPLLLVLYGVAMRALFERDRAAGDDSPPARHDGASLRSSIARFGAAAGVVAAAGSALPFVSAELARIMGWSESFVGTLFVALATSLPEVAVTLSAVRIGAAEMAVANLLGSNLFDMAVLAVDDLFHLGGPILAHVAPVHAVSALVAMAMSAAVAWMPHGRAAGAVLLALYAANAALLHRLGG
jgi:cation:H+ antiporter